MPGQNQPCAIVGRAVSSERMSKLKDGQRCIIRETFPEKGEMIVDIVAHGRITATGQLRSIGDLHR